MDTEVVDGQEEKQEVGPSVRYWISQIEASKKASTNYWDSAKAAWQEYLGDIRSEFDVRRAANEQNTATRFPIYWASSRMIEPALYSRTPIPIAEKVFDSLDDNIARLASLGLERLSKYCMRRTPFDRAQYMTRDTFIHGNKSTNRVLFDAYIEQNEEKVYFTPTQQQGPDGQPIQVFVSNSGEQADPSQLQQDEQGFFAVNMQEKLKSVCVELVPIHYKDVLHNCDARHQEEIWWMGYRTTQTRDEAREMFGPEVAAKLPFAKKDHDHESSAESNLAPETIDIWEIWNKRKKEVYWYAEGYSNELLKPLNYQGGDPYELAGFFPSPPFIIGTCGPDSMMPQPDYKQLKPLIEQIHAMADRLRILVRASRVQGVFDSSVPELKELQNNTSDAIWIGVENFKEIVGDAGLEGLIKTFNKSEIVEAINQLTATIQLYKEQFSEMWGVSDLMRGTSDPNETAQAQQLKGKYNSLRFSSVCREFQRLVRDDIELMCDLALKKFPQQKLADIMGVRFWKPEEQQLWPQVLLLLQDDNERQVRIEIQTDSTSTMNENAEIEHRNFLGKTLFEGISTMGQVAQSTPAMVPAIAETVLFVVQGLKRESKEVEQAIRYGVQQTINPPPPPQPPPDYEMMKIENERMKIQQQAQIDMQKVQLAYAQLQVATQKAVIEMKKVQSQMTEGQAKTAIEAQVAQLEAYLESKWLELESTKVEASMESEQHERMEGEIGRNKDRTGSASPTLNIHLGQ